MKNVRKIMHPIPFFSLARQWNEYKDELTLAINSIFDTQQYVGGGPVESFEKKLASYVGTSHAIGCNSGTDALWMALAVLGVKKGDIVLTTPFSFIASASEIVRHEAQPVFIDICPSTYLLDIDLLKTWLQKETVRTAHGTFHKITGQQVKGILTVDIFGNVLDYEKLHTIAQEYGLWIIEDACQAIGSSRGGKKAGSFGTISTFSFYPTKNIGACGDAGALTTDNQELAAALLKLRNHGRVSAYSYEQLGINSRLDGIQAAILNKKLDHIESVSKKRREHAKHYLSRLSTLPFIALPMHDIEVLHTYHQFSVHLLPEAGVSRNMACELIEKEGVGTRIFYPEPLHKIPFLKPPRELETECPIAHLACENIFSLPIWPELFVEEVEKVCTVLEDIVHSLYSPTIKASPAPSMAL